MIAYRRYGRATTTHCHRQRIVSRRRRLTGRRATNKSVNIIQHRETHGVHCISFINSSDRDSPVAELAACVIASFEHYGRALIVNTRPGIIGISSKISANIFTVYLNRAAAPGTGIDSQSKVYTVRTPRWRRRRRRDILPAKCTIIARAAAGIGHPPMYFPMARRRCSPVDRRRVPTT